jgi:hypothetical protein
MKSLSIIITLSISINFNLLSQPEIIWKKCFGGTQGEQFTQIKVSENNDIYFVGSTTSNDGDVSGNHGDNDVWIGKINENGELVWQKCLGGSAMDLGMCLERKGEFWILTLKE